MNAAVVTPEQLATINGRPPSVAHMFFDRVNQSGDREAIRYPDADEKWHSMTWRQVGDEVTRLAAGLVALGIEPGQRVAIAASTRHEWILADLAINAAAAATTTVYPSTGAEDTAYILSDSDSRIVFAEDDDQVKKLVEQRAALPNLTTVVTFEPSALGEDWVISLEELASRGSTLLANAPTTVEDRVATLTPNALATLIYTSGTTGKPKGVRLAHDGWTYEAYALKSADILAEDDLEFRWLPMAHSFGKVLLSAQLAVGYASAIDGRVPKIVENLAIIRPTFMGAAPRIFEKAYGGVNAMMEKEGGAKLKLFRWAEKVGLEHSRAVRSGKSVPPGLKIKFALADKLVFSKVRERFGGRVKFFISGSAALSRDIGEWFHAAGMLILEGYGLTETSAGATINRPDAFKLGSVGLPLPGSEVKIAEDGEVLIKGPNVMRGYHNLPDESAAAMLGDGWFASGDIGELDADGFLRITDRKKDLFKTSGGKYIAPTYIEGMFKGISPLVSNILVHGNERNFCSALITLEADAATAWAAQHGLAGKSYAEIAASPQIQEEMQSAIDELNSKLNRWETIKKFAVLDRDLTVESGELTPSLKVKRKVVEDNFRDILEGFYA
ncbi:MAG TPA: long-chain fatty acid--CoA ligase [Aeromicrobium sp.]|nr:long-chain fatty acid--CoA ligase [Aeromicrobium sp.]HKY57108.1 long-chain fatty acid--CoA ligase [Aeromicrobium sp.]